MVMKPMLITRMIRVKVFTASQQILKILTTHNVLTKAFYQINDNHRIGFTGEYFFRSAEGANPIS